MRGHPDVGSIQEVAEVVPHIDGGFKGRLSIPFDGTRYTDVHPTKEAAAAALAVLQAKVFPKASSTGISARQDADIKAAFTARGLTPA